MMTFFSITAFSVLAPEMEEQRSGVSENSVLPPIGVLGCEECMKAVMSGKNKGDVELIQYHQKQIWGSEGNKNSGKALDGE